MFSPLYRKGMPGNQSNSFQAKITEHSFGFHNYSLLCYISRNTVRNIIKKLYFRQQKFQSPNIFKCRYFPVQFPPLTTTFNINLPFFLTQHFV